MKKRAFTLAEVLITLGIIGVVAAMTIPTLIVNTNSMKFKSQFKKTLSALNQAVKMSEAKYDLNFASVNDCGYFGALEKPEVNATLCAIFNATLSGATFYRYAKDIKIPGTRNQYSVSIPSIGRRYGSVINDNVYLLANGSMFVFQGTPGGGRGCALENLGDDPSSLTRTPCYGFIDVNGATLPNKEVTCSNVSTVKSSAAGDCIVRNNSTNMGDIFPVVYHDGVVEPLTNAGWYVLKNSK